MSKIKKLKIPSEDRTFNVDPTGLTPVSPFVKDGILLHKLQAQGPRKHAKTKEVLLQGLSLLTNGMSVVYRLRLLF